MWQPLLLFACMHAITNHSTTNFICSKLLAWNAFVFIKLCAPGPPPLPSLSWSIILSLFLSLLTVENGSLVFVLFSLHLESARKCTRCKWSFYYTNSFAIFSSHPNSVEAYPTRFINNVFAELYAMECWVTATIQISPLILDKFVLKFESIFGRENCEKYCTEIRCSGILRRPVHDYGGKFPVFSWYEPVYFGPILLIWTFHRKIFTQPDISSKLQKKVAFFQ